MYKYSVRGPINALYSIFLPGLGNYRVSYGVKGKNIYKSLLVFSAIGYGAKLYSNNQYNKYQEATSTNEMNKYYSIANTSNIVFLSSFGIASTIYLNEILSSARRGLKNKNKSRFFRKKIRKNPIKLISNPIIIP